MAQSFLVFDFGTNEEAAQQAWHRIEGWKQGFRLGAKMQAKFDRSESAAAEQGDEKEQHETKGHSAKKPGGKKKHSGEKEKEDKAAENIRILLRLDFSDHEKLSHHRWLERIPGEEPFKDASPQVVRHGDPEFAKTSEAFDSLT